MKSIISLCIAVFLFCAAGYFATMTVTEKIGQQCSSSDDYRNEWRDTYWLFDWYPNRDTGTSFIACVGPSQYVRYHPVDVAAVSFVGALTAGFIAYRSETMYTKKSKPKETK